MEKFNRIKRELVYRGVILDFCKDTVITPEDKKVEWDYISHKGAAAIVPVMDDGSILMVKQWRNTMDRFTWEIPAGGREDFDKTTLECASRELEEETGYRSDNFEFLQTTVPAIAYSGEKIDIYIAFDLVKSRQNLDEDEDIFVKSFPVEELIEMIKNNEINDSKTISAIATYYIKYVLDNR